MLELIVLFLGITFGSIIGDIIFNKFLNKYSKKPLLKNMELKVGDIYISRFKQTVRDGNNKVEVMEIAENESCTFFSDDGDYVTIYDAMVYPCILHKQQFLVMFNKAVMPNMKK